MYGTFDLVTRGFVVTSENSVGLFFYNCSKTKNIKNSILRNLRTGRSVVTTVFVGAERPSLPPSLPVLYPPVMPLILMTMIQFIHCLLVPLGSR